MTTPFLPRFAFFSFVSLAAVACMPPGAVRAPDGSGGDGASAEGTVPGARDPRIQALATKAAACKLEDGSFDDECEAYKAWKDADEEFEEGKGDATLLAMFEDADPKMRVLATHKSMSSTFLEQPATFPRLRAVLAKEKVLEVRKELARIFVKLPGDRPEVVAVWKQLATDPDAEVRHTLGFYLSQGHPEALAVSMKLMNDPEERVREGALSGIGMATSFGKNEPACQALVELLRKDDDVRGHTQWTAAATSCKSVSPPLLASLLARTADAAKLEKGIVGYSLALDMFCADNSSATADQKKRAFEAAKRLVDPKVKTNRWAGVKSLAKCDPVAGKALVAKLVADKDATVSKEAKETLAKIGAKSAPAKK
jgi:HEAT repeat protein